jgi:hypothetical protein
MQLTVEITLTSLTIPNHKMSAAIATLTLNAVALWTSEEVVKTTPKMLLAQVWDREIVLAP